MSLQAQPQQPTQIYPATITNQPQNSHHYSNGSFGTVFIVLAIILVISVVACVLGRLCNKRYNKNHQNYNNNHQSQSQRNHHVKPNRQQIHHMQSPREGDIEFGVENNQKRMPTIATRPNLNGHVHGAGTGPPPMMQPHHGNNIRGFEIKHGHGAELREDA